MVSFLTLEEGPMLRSRALSAPRLLCACGAMALGLLLVVFAGPAHAATTCTAGPSSLTCSNPGSITILDATTDGTPMASDPEPSTIDVGNITGPVTKVTATVNGFTHSCPTDVDMLLVGPQGQDSILMSDIGDCTHTARPGINLTFDDSAASAVPCLGVTPPNTTTLPGGTYKPTDGPAGVCASAGGPTADSFVVGSPLGPVGPYPTGLATFNGVNPNGTWRLYTVDQWTNDAGQISGGWSIRLTIPAPTVASPAIVGTARVGQTLSVRAGAVTNATPSFQWKRCDVGGTVCDVIGGASGLTYSPTSADVGKALVVTETAANSGGTTSANSVPTAAVQPATITTAPAVTLKGTKSTQHVIRQRGVSISVKSDQAGSLVATGTVRVGHKSYHFKRAKATLAANTKTTIKLGLSSKTFTALRAALVRGKHLKARITLTVTTAAGKTTRHKTITLKR
jgi:hypothetical protein